MSHGQWSLYQLESLYIKLWSEMHNVEVEREPEPYELASVLNQLIFVVEGMSPAEVLPVEDTTPPKEEKTSEPEPTKEEQEWATYKEWQEKGRQVYYGQKARKFENKVAYFHINQTQPKEKKKKIDYTTKEYPNQEDHPDNVDHDDDIPF